MTYEDFLGQWNDGLDYIVAHTSGSTGAPKEIRLPKSDMLASASATNSRFGIGRDSVLTLPLSLGYIAGKMMAVRAILAGCRLNVVAPSNEFSLPDGSTDLLAVVPSQVAWLLRHGEWSKRIKNVIIGGAPLDLEQQAQMRECGYKAFCTYGMTETCSHVALQEVTGDREPFIAMDGVRFATDNRGCLVVNLRDMSVGSIVTNDIVDLVNERMFYWKGRIDNVINSGGVKIHPEEVEALIGGLVKSRFLIRGFKHEKWGEAVELVIEGGKTDQDLPQKLRELLPAASIPKKITYVAQIERTKNGKIKRF